MTDPRPCRATAHSNIALVKYWGKREGASAELNLPAVGSLSMTLDVLRTVTTVSPSPQDRFELSRVLAMLAGLAADGNSGVTATEAASFADQAVAALRHALEAGWGRYEYLKEPDFDAIRGREDFKKLVAEVEAKAEK